MGDVEQCPQRAHRTATRRQHQLGRLRRHAPRHRGAYESLQDRLKNDFLKEFARSYAAVHGEPLKLGKRSIRNTERHLSFVDPQNATAPAEERKLYDRLRARVQGKYATGAIKDKVDNLLRGQEIERQNQVSMFGSTPKLRS